MVESVSNVGDPRFNPWVGKIPWRGKWQPALVFSPGEFHGQRSLVGYTVGRRKIRLCNAGRRVRALWRWLDLEVSV